jgi:hypothetical protein
MGSLQMRHHGIGKGRDCAVLALMRVLPAPPMLMLEYYVLGRVYDWPLPPTARYLSR